VLAVGLLVWASMVDLPYDADVGFDVSWRLVLHWAATERLAFGREFVFSYGPLGHLLTRAYAGSGLWDYLAAQVVLAGLVIGLGLGSIPRLTLPRVLALALFLALFAWGETLVVVLLLLLAGTAIPRGVESIAGALAVGSLCGVLAVARPTTLSLGAIVTLGAAASSSRSRRPWVAATLLGGAAAGFAAGWHLSGQALVELPLFLVRSVQYARGNLESMAWEESWLTFGIGVSVLALLLAGSASLLAAGGLRHATLPIATAALWGFTFVKWKHGFVRADTHVNHFFLFALLLAILYSLFEPPGGTTRKLRFACFSLAVPLSIAGSLIATPGGGLGWARSLAGRTAHKLASLAHLGQLQARYDERWREVRVATALPASRAVIGHSAVDVVGPAQGLVFTNALHYRPRPVFQSWAAYSGELNRINEEFFLSSRRPEMVLQQFQTIDRRLPSQDDARVLPLLLRDYELVHVEKGNLLWRESRPAPTGAPDPRVVLDERVAFGETVRLGDGLRGEDLWLQIDYRPSVLGRVLMLLYKLPSAWLHVECRGVAAREFRLLRLVAGDGFLLSPHFRDAADWTSYVMSGDALRPTGFRVSIPPGRGRYFDPELRVRVSIIDLEPDSPVSE
jgi:hypothetical protein